MATHSSHDLLESMLKRTPVGAQSCSGPLQNTDATKLQVLVHCLVIQVFSSQISTVVISTNFADASSTSSHCNSPPCRCVISRLGLSVPSADPFALASTPCRCRTTPRSRITETQPIPAAAALTAALNSASTLERLTTACVVNVNFRKCLPWKILQERVLLRLCKHPAK